MRTFDIKVRAIVEKVVRVEADDEETAIQRAHQEFTLTSDGSEENYDEKTLWVKEVCDR